MVACLLSLSVDASQQSYLFFYRSIDRSIDRSIYLSIATTASYAVVATCRCQTMPPRARSVATTAHDALAAIAGRRPSGALTATTGSTHRLTRRSPSASHADGAITSLDKTVASQGSCSSV